MSKQVFLTEERLEDLLQDVGVKIAYHTSTDIIAYCCFHDNKDSPAFNISKRSPYLWKCWNGRCGQQGNIFTLLTKKGYSNKEARRLLLKGEVQSTDDFDKLIKELLKEEDDTSNEWHGIDPQKFANEDKDHGYPARQYALDRGISLEAYEYFRMGFSAKKRMLIIPVFDDRNRFSGVVGRSIEGKRYQYSTGLDRSGIIWNLNNAKDNGSDLIITEGALDSVAIWQAGYGCVGAIFGSSVSTQQWKLIRQYFGNITVFCDNDAAGMSVRDSILEHERALGVSVVEYPGRECKDPGDLTADEIRHMIMYRKSSIELLLG